MRIEKAPTVEDRGLILHSVGGHLRMRALLMPINNKPTLLATASATLPSRFWSKVEKSDTCWEWRGAKLPTGYGYIRVSAERGAAWEYAHRISYLFANYEIPDGLVIDHLCQNTSCVRPAHLEVVTQQTNILRGNGMGAQNARKTECINGHPFTEENTYHRPGSVYRSCRACNYESGKRRRARKLKSRWSF